MTLVEMTTREADIASILALTQDLVRMRSTPGASTIGRVLVIANDFLQSRGVRTRFVGDPAKPVALVAEIRGATAGQTLCLNACADTAPIGLRRTWMTDPFSADVIDGWLYGRGAADSKVGISIFCHVLSYYQEQGLPAGRLLACFDIGEHSGTFVGMRSFLKVEPAIDAAMIGYPGQDALRIGARGFWRGSITVYGVEQHSASRKEPRNAITKAARLVDELTHLGAGLNNGGLSPQLTVTGIRGGSGFSTVPDSCVVRVDVRLTPDFDATAAEDLVRTAIATADAVFSYERPSDLRRRESWPAYELSSAEPVVAALAHAVEDVLGQRLNETVASPSNVGNLLAARGIPATCGFGVRFRGMHGPDEACEIGSIGSVLAVYTHAVDRFTRTDPPAGPDR